MKILKLNKASVLFLILAVLSILFPLFHSLLNGEASFLQSSFFVDFIAKNIYVTNDSQTIFNITVFVRKLAHFTEFAVFFSFFNCFMCAQKIYKNKAYVFLALFALVFLPLIDETVQYLSPGRTPLVSDIWVDAAGGAVGIAITGVIFWLVRLKQHKAQKQ